MLNQHDHKLSHEQGQRHRFGTTRGRLKGVGTSPRTTARWVAEGRQAPRSTWASTASPAGGCSTPRPNLAMRSMKPGTRSAMPAPPQAPHCTALPGRPAPCTPTGS
jgi:hypothetical protein